MSVCAGMSVWQELVVADPGGVAEFYADVLGWTVELDGTTGVFSNRGTPVAGLRVDQTVAAGRSGWIVYLAVDDMAAAERAVVDAGGTVLDGEHAVSGQETAGALLADRDGAVFGVLPSTVTTVSAPSPEFGRMALVDVMTYGVDAGLPFFDAVFGAARVHAEAKMHVYRAEDGSALFGVNELKPAEREVLPPHWLPWFSVRDSDAALDTAAVSGGHVHVRDQKFVFGKWGVTADPSGAAFKTLELHVPTI